MECPDVWVDSFGDGCEWYDDYPSGCGDFDTACGSAWDECEACWSTTWTTDDDGCVSSDWVESWNDGCWWYDYYPDDCGWCDTALGSAWDECCGCGGGTSTPVYSEPEVETEVEAEAEAETEPYSEPSFPVVEEEPEVVEEPEEPVAEPEPSLPCETCTGFNDDLGYPCYTLEMWDSYDDGETFGNGWNGNSFNINGQSYYPFGPGAGAYDTAAVCLPLGCYDVSVDGNDWAQDEISWSINGYEGGAPY